MIAGEIIKQERIKRNLSQEELGKLLNVTKVSVCGYETGTRTPTIDTLKAICQVLNISSDSIIGNNTFFVKEEETPYGSITESEIKLIKELRKCNELHEILCQNPSEINKLNDLYKNR